MDYSGILEYVNFKLHDFASFLENWCVLSFLIGQCAHQMLLQSVFTLIKKSFGDQQELSLVAYKNNIVHFLTTYIFLQQRTFLSIFASCMALIAHTVISHTFYKAPIDIPS